MSKFDNLHTEKAVLALVLQNPDMLIDLDGAVKLDYFGSPINREILQVCLDLYNKGYSALDKELVYNQLLMHNVDSVTMEQLWVYLSSLFSVTVSQLNFKNYLGELTNIYTKNRLRQTLHTSLEKLEQQPKDTDAYTFIDYIQNEIMSISVGSTTDEPEDICSNVEQHLQSKLDDPAGNIGIPTGIPLLDDLMLGYLKTKFYFVAARPGRGKSAFMMQSAIHASFFAEVNRVPVLYIDTEIGTPEFTDRVLAHLSGVNAMSIMRGNWIDDPIAVRNIDKAKDLMNHNKEMLFHKYVPGFKTSQVISMIKKFVYNHGVGLVIFDYIKEPRDVDDDKARWQKIGDLARSLKELAGQLEIPVLTALQQNRKGEGVSRTDASAMGESDDVLKEADMAFMLNWKTPKELQAETIEAGTHRFQIVKGRYTASVYGGINLNYYGYCFKFKASTIQNLVSEDLNATISTIQPPIKQENGLFSDNQRYNRTS